MIEAPATYREGVALAQLSRLVLTLEQTDAQRAVKIVRIGYAYALTCSQVECERNASFTVTLDVLGHDLLRDDLLASGLDTHIVECGGSNCAPIETKRSILVGQSLLDEDIGTDEIKVRVIASDGAGESSELTSAIVRGNF